MLAMAFLTVVRAKANVGKKEKKTANFLKNICATVGVVNWDYRLLRYASTASAAQRPSCIAQTTRLAPRFASPAANTPGFDV